MSLKPITAACIGGACELCPGVSNTGLGCTHSCHPVTRLDVAAIEAVWQQTRRSVAEYALLPSTTRRTVEAPCIRRCGRTANTHRGVCRTCLKGER